MTIEVLLSVMHQKNHELIAKMNIQSDAVIVNQCADDSVEKFLYDNHSIIWINTTQRGLSKSRNMALSYATAEICLIADEDEVLENGYPRIVEEAFNRYPKADIISFNYHRINAPTQIKTNKSGKGSRFKYYSSVSLAFKLNKIKKHGLHFNEMIGAGSEYCAGEETVFEQECRKKGLKIYEYSSIICSVDSTTSTWFKGFDETYFFNLGVILAIRHGIWARLYAFYYVYRFRRDKAVNKIVLLRSIYSGISRFKTL